MAFLTEREWLECVLAITEFSKEISPSARREPMVASLPKNRPEVEAIFTTVRWMASTDPFVSRV